MKSCPYILLTLKAFITKSRMLLSSADIFEASLSEDPDQTAHRREVWSGSTLFASILMITNQQTFSDVVILLAF